MRDVTSCRLRALLVCIPVLVAAGCAHELEPGPLGDEGDGGSFAGGPIPVGHFLTLGVWLPANKSGKDAFLESLAPADADSARGLELRYAAVRLPDRRCQAGVLLGWPPRPCPVGHLQRVDGFRYPSGSRRTEILVGARSSRPGVWSISSFRLRYRVGGRRYAAVYTQGMMIRSNPTFAFESPQRDVVCQDDERERWLECQLSVGGIRPHPATCHADPLVGYSLRAGGRAEIMCGRRELIRPRAALRSSLRRTGFVCVLRAAGVRCHNKSGHGFFVSRRRSYTF